MSTHKTRTGSVLARTGLTVAVGAALVGGLAPASYATTATQQAITLSSPTGPVGGANTLTLSLSATASPKFSSGKIGVQIQATTSALQAAAVCSTNPATTANNSVTAVGTTTRYLGTTKASFVVPELDNGTSASPAGPNATDTTLVGTGYWLVCAYNAAPVTGVIPTTATVIGKAAYLTAAAPTVALNSATPAGVVPASGPAIGGQTVTIHGTNLPTAITATTPLTATLGGQPMTSITPIDATSFTAVTPVHSPGAAALQVTTAGGTVTTATNIFSFVNGISVSPNTVPSGVSVDVDVQGTGFSTLSFDTSATPDNSGVTQTVAGDSTGTNSANAHVYLVKGTYNPAAYAAGANKTNGQVAECINPAVISDTEMICTVDASKSVTVAAHVYTYGATALVNGPYTMTVVGSGDLLGYTAGTTYQSVVSSGATFTISDF